MNNDLSAREELVQMKQEIERLQDKLKTIQHSFEDESISKNKAIPPHPIISYVDYCLFYPCYCN